MDFNKITIEEENAAKLRFLNLGQGVSISKYANETGQPVLWHQVIDPKLYSEQTIIDRMKNLGRTINTMVEDEFVGSGDIAFSHTDEFDNIHYFTYLDCYLFLRAALRHRRDSAEYKQKQKEIAELERQIEQAKTVSEKRREAKEKLAALKASV